MQIQRLPLQETLQSLPPEWDDDLLPHIEAALKASERKIVILDDDVMGTQSVHDIAVLIDWSVDALRAELEADSRAFFVVTNARTMPESQARAVNSFITRNLCEAAQQAGVDFSIVSRLDSTLRGHFPAEMQAIESELPRKPNGWIVAPLFREGGRYTINDTQYVAEQEMLIPVGDTEFALDPAFSFKSSDLRNWVEEKTAGEVTANSVASVTIDELRLGGPANVAVKLSAMPEGGVCVVNGASDRDMEVFVQGMLEVEAGGRRFLFRAAASFIKALLGQSDRPLLTPEDMGMNGSGGMLIVVGSHVPRTTQQLDRLLIQSDAIGVEANVNPMLSDATRQSEIDRAIAAAEDVLASQAETLSCTLAANSWKDAAPTTASPSGTRYRRQYRRLLAALAPVHAVSSSRAARHPTRSQRRRSTCGARGRRDRPRRVFLRGFSARRRFIPACPASSSPEMWAMRMRSQIW